MKIILLMMSIPKYIFIQSLSRRFLSEIQIAAEEDREEKKEMQKETGIY